MNDSSTMANSFRTIAEPGYAQTRALGSRFFGTAAPAGSADELLLRLDDEKRQRHDATHWCFAARFGVAKELTERSSDAGEPHGTAGLPILREIKKRDLTDCLVIVTRYFGSTKLGTGNLARAYGECAALALEAASVAVRLITRSLRIECDYADQAIVYHVARRFQAALEAVPSSRRAEFIFRLAPDLVAAVAAALRDDGGGRILVQEIAS
ncbi:MAG: YigZ family protein [bacterium]|nr:YigZ family protein [bacterium]